VDAIKEAWQPVAVELMKFLAVVVSLLIVNILTILRNRFKDNILKVKILDWAIAKAIKMEGKEFEGWKNSSKWQRLVEHAAKVGITEAMLKKFEAEIMAGVENYKSYEQT
jgi:hypothetical protein